MTRPRTHGSAIAEALVAVTLVALAAASIASTAAAVVRSLVLARDLTTAQTLATERLEALRIGPRLDGSDVQAGAGGVDFARRWTVEDGRGLPARLAVEVAWRNHRLLHTTETLP